MTGKRIAACMISALLVFQPLAAAAQADAEELEGFRSELISYVRSLEALPVTLLETMYDDPVSLLDARESIQLFTTDELRNLRSALDQVPYWRSLPSILATSIPAEDFFGPLELAASLDVNRHLLGSPQSREGLLEFLDRMDGLRSNLPPGALSDEFSPRIVRLRASIEGLTVDELITLRQAMQSRSPLWATKVREAERQQQQARRSGAPLARSHCGPADNCGSGESFPSNILCEVENIIDEIIAIPCRVGEFAEVAGEFILEQLLALLTFLTDLLPSEEELSSALQSAVTGLIDLFRARPHDWPLDVFPGQREAMLARGIDPRTVDPTLAVPCPIAFGTDADDPADLTESALSLPVIGQFGDRRASVNCTRRVEFLPSMITELFPSDVTSTKVKVVFFIAQSVVFIIKYLCLCYEAAAEIRFDDVQQLHRELVSERFCKEGLSDTQCRNQALTDMVKVSDLATKTEVAGVTTTVGGIDGQVATLQVSLADLRLDIADLDADIAVVDGKAAALLTDIGDSAQALSDFQDLALQLRIEADLVRDGNDRIALFQLPATVDGLIEVVAGILTDLINERETAGRDVTNARFFLMRGDFLYNELSFKKAYTEYRKAYRELVLTR